MASHARTSTGFRQGKSTCSPPIVRHRLHVCASSARKIPSKVSMPHRRSEREREREHEAELKGSNNILPTGTLFKQANNLNRHRCLILDVSYRPVNVANWLRALMMQMQEKCEVLVYYEGAYAISGQGHHPLPAVLRTPASVSMFDKDARLMLTRQHVLMRDAWTCQYCGGREALTLDHVTPLCAGGRHSWDNLVAACTVCNNRKGAQSLRSLGWALRTKPWEPKPHELGVIAGLRPDDIERPPPEWEAYVSGLRSILKRPRGVVLQPDTPQRG